MNIMSTKALSRITDLCRHLRRLRLTKNSICGYCKTEKECHYIKHRARINRDSCNTLEVVVSCPNEKCKGSVQRLGLTKDQHCFCLNRVLVVGRTEAHLIYFEMPHQTCVMTILNWESFYAIHGQLTSAFVSAGYQYA